MGKARQLISKRLLLESVYVLKNKLDYSMGLTTFFIHLLMGRSSAGF
jgi:hypothetical protein